MLIDWAHFTPITSLFGGVLIGIAVAILLIFNGKIAGISGIIGGLLRQASQDKFWRIAFLFGLFIAPSIWQLFSPLPTIEIKANATTLIIAGLLVGFGTRLGNGCTSGHGVCGLSRFSKRSFIATTLFMSLGFISTYIVRHLI